jgi:hypothetical protein
MTDATQTPQDAEELDQAVTEDIGGVQGGDEDADDGEQVAQSIQPGATPDQPAPDGAEIEWAGGLVKKPPTPVGGGDGNT